MRKLAIDGLFGLWHDGRCGGRMRRKLLASTLLLASAFWVIGASGILPLYQHAPREMFSATDPGDLILAWYGCREMVLRGRNPYGEAVIAEVRQIVKPEQHGLTDPKWGQMVYPAYTALLLLPTLWMPFSAVQFLFFWLLLAGVVASLYLWLEFLEIPLSPAAFLAATFLLLLSPSVLQALILRQLAVVVALLISASAVLLRRRHFFFAGVLLALAGIKPQMLAMLLIWLLAWSMADWKERKGFAFGFAAAMAVMLVACEGIFPGWISLWLGALHNAREHGELSILEIMGGHTFGLVAAAGAAFCLAVALFRLRAARADSPEFMFAFSLVLLVQLIVLPLTRGYNYLIAIPAILLLLKPALVPGVLREGCKAILADWNKPR